MCIHSEKELLDILRLYNPLRVSAVIIRDAADRFIGAWHCDPTDAYSIANTLRNLTVWHPDVRPHADLSMVNEARKLLGLKPLIDQRLPPPSRPPLPAMDNDRETIQEWYRAAKRAAERQIKRLRAPARAVVIS